MYVKDKKRIMFLMMLLLLNSLKLQKKLIKLNALLHNHSIQIKNETKNVWNAYYVII